MTDREDAGRGRSTGAARPMLLALSYLAFVSLGLPDAVVGVAWPSLRAQFDLPQSGLGAVLVGAGAGYFLSGLLAGRLIQALGVGTLLAASTALVTLGLFGYAAAPGWPLFLVWTPLVGLGSGAIDAGLNAYAAHHFPPRHMNWLHACYGVGAMLGPLAMTAVLASGSSWRAGYRLLGAALVLMTIAFLATRRSWRDDAAGDGHGEPPATTGAALRRPLVWLQVAIFFVYTGLEVTAGQWSFTLYREARGLPEEAAGVWTGLYWGSLASGRILLGFVVERLGPDRLLRLAVLGAAAGSLLFAFGGLGASLAGFVLLGFSLAPIYPTLMARTPARLGPGVAAHAVGFQVSAAMIGAAALPTLAGLLAAGLGLEAITWVVAAAAGLLWLLHELLLRLTAGR